MEVGGTTPGSGHDQLDVSGAASLNGTLNVTTLPGFTPSEGQSFQFLKYPSRSGQFATVNGTINTFLRYDVQYNATDSRLVVGTIGYPRPAGATPVRASLVPSYKTCSLPNRRHGPPLDHPSCNPPAATSPHLTVGTPDANGAGANSTGSVRLDVDLGFPGPVEDSDVRMTFSVTDVRNAGSLTDYTGELQVTGAVRITDRLNGPSETERATVQDTTFPVTAPCVSTRSTTIGAACSVTTTYNAVVPGAIREGRRAIWQLDQVQVFDGGPDGDVDTASGNTLFLKQGIFVP